MWDALRGNPRGVFSIRYNYRRLAMPRVKNGFEGTPRYFFALGGCAFVMVGAMIRSKGHGSHEMSDDSGVGRRGFRAY